YFTSGRVLASSLNGLETALATCLYAAACWVLWVGLRGPASPRWEAAFAAVLGGLFLARTDMIFSIGGLGLLALGGAGLGPRRRRWGWRWGPPGWPWPLSILSCAGIRAPGISTACCFWSRCCSAGAWRWRSACCPRWRVAGCGPAWGAGPAAWLARRAWRRPC